MQQTNDIFFHPENNEGGFFMLSFDTGLLLVKDASFTTAKRLKSYASSAEAAAGLGRRHEKTPPERCESVRSVSGCYSRLYFFRGRIYP